MRHGRTGLPWPPEIPVRMQQTTKAVSNMTLSSIKGPIIHINSARVLPTTGQQPRGKGWQQEHNATLRVHAGTMTTLKQDANRNLTITPTLI